MALVIAYTLCYLAQHTNQLGTRTYEPTEVEREGLWKFDAHQLEQFLICSFVLSEEICMRKPNICIQCRASCPRFVCCFAMAGKMAVYIALLESQALKRPCSWPRSNKGIHSLDSISVIRA
jgi:hypothetical protein